MKTRCPKCGENHNIQNCNRQAEEKPCCANCGGDHKAAYKGCPYYKALRDKQRQRREEGGSKTQSAQHPQQHHQFQLRNEEFPALRSHTQQLPAQQPTMQWRKAPPNETNTADTITGFQEIGDLLQQANIGHLLTFIADTLRKVINAKSDKDKALILLQELSKLN